MGSGRVSSAMGIACLTLLRSAGFHDLEFVVDVDEEESSEWPRYVVVYVQSYGLVATVSGMGRLDVGSVLHRMNIDLRYDIVTFIPAFQPCIGVPNLHTPITLLEFTIPHSFQCVQGIKGILPFRRLMVDDQ